MTQKQKKRTRTQPVTIVSEQEEPKLLDVKIVRKKQKPPQVRRVRIVREGGD